MKLTEQERLFAAHILGVFGGRLCRDQHPEEAKRADESLKDAKERERTGEPPPPFDPDYRIPDDHYIRSRTEQLRRQFAMELLAGDWPKDDSAEGWNR